MRISDWSSDVCSSDLNEPVPHPRVGSPPPPAVDALPEGDPDASGEAPPMPGEASPQSREQKRFARYDRNSDGVISRVEMKGSRARAVKALDRDNDKNGREPCRERGCQEGESWEVDGALTKKKKNT